MNMTRLSVFNDVVLLIKFIGIAVVSFVVVPLVVAVVVVVVVVVVTFFSSSSLFV